MATKWCNVCCTIHDGIGRCPGELIAAEPERHGWRVNVETPHGIEAYGVLVTETKRGYWRARIMTYPNVLWAVPGGDKTIKFVAGSAAEVEGKAVDYIRTHCRERGFKLRKEVSLWTPDNPAAERYDRARPVPATRVIRFLPIRFGVVNPSEIGGTGNLSETGVFVITNHPLEVNSRLRLLLELEAQRIALTGDVRWMNRSHRVGRSPGMGVRLHTPPDRYAEYVRTLV